VCAKNSTLRNSYSVKTVQPRMEHLLIVVVVQSTPVAIGVAEVLNLLSNEEELEVVLDAYLEQPGRQIPLERLFELLHMNKDYDDRMAKFIQYSWHYIVNHPELWNHRYSCVEELESAVDYAETVLPYEQACSELSGRIATENKTIIRQWGVSITTAFPSAIRPIHLTEGYAREVAKLSRVCTRTQAIHDLEIRVKARLDLQSVE